MSSLHALTDAQVILLAAQFIADVNVESLQIIAAERKDVLTNDIIYRLLLTLYPTDDTARSALLALLKSVHRNYADVSALDSQVDTSSITKLSQSAILRHAEQLQLDDIIGKNGSGDSFEDFMVSWIHRIEAIDGGIENILPLVDELALECPGLQLWSQTYLVPIIQLQYHFYPDVQPVLGVQELESLSGTTGVRALLQYAEKLSTKAQIARDLQEVVAPWIQGSTKANRRRTNEEGPRHTTTSWRDVNEWILSTSMKDFHLAAKVLIEWEGPNYHDLDGKKAQLKTEYAQAGLAIIYANGNTSEDVIKISKLILRRVAAISDLRAPDVSSPEFEHGLAAVSLGDVSDADLLVNSLLRSNNQLSRVSEASTAFLAGILHTAELLRQYKIFLSISDVTRTCLSGSEERQKQELRRILQQLPRLTSIVPDWQSTRRQLHWLRSWRAERQEAGPERHHQSLKRTYLAHVPLEYLETELLDSILVGGQYEAVRRLFLESPSAPLELAQVEDRVVAAIYSAYDNASNGNRTRGGMKRAYELLTVFQPLFPQSEKLREIAHLIKATHSLSFYQLTLQHGVPFQPVNIRALKNPLSLVSKVVEQNLKAYTKLDDLLEIGRNLVLAQLSTTSITFDEEATVKSRIFDAEHRITYLAITSALSADDFDTAYSYVTTRLSTSPSQASSGDFMDDTSWRAAYAAGKYRPNLSPKSLHACIASLSKRMDLLSLALTLAPSQEPLSEILGTWTRCEEEMEHLKTEALDEERAFEARSDGTVPGGFGLEDRELDAAETKKALARRTLAGNSATYEEEAPLGLFDVSKAAVNAFRRSAFPLGSSSMDELKIRDAPSRQSSMMSGTQSTGTTEDGSRVRKRDMITGGLVSGMSWVLGAQPASKDED